jgi:hypothetical protein
MEQSPCWEDDSHSDSQEIPRLLWNLKVHYRVHKGPPLAPTLSQIHPVHTLPPYFPNIHSNIILPSTLRSLDWSLPFWFSDQNYVYISHLSHACYMPHSPHLSSYVHPNNNWRSVQVMKLLIMQSFPPSLVQMLSWAPCFQTPSIHITHPQ